MSKLCQRDYPHRLLPLRPAFGYLYRGASANFGLSLPEMPAAIRQFLYGASTFPGFGGCHSWIFEDL